MTQIMTGVMKGKLVEKQDFFNKVCLFIGSCYVLIALDLHSCCGSVNLWTPILYEIWG
jgi:hypothetical protein